MKTTLHRRQTTLETLRSSGALFLWHPLLVDAALDLPADFRHLGVLVSDPAFVHAIDQIILRAPSLANTLDEDRTGKLLDRSRFLAKPFLAAMRKKVLTRMKLTVHANPLLSEEIDEQLRFEYLRMADRFIPGIIESDGTVRTFGFKAFLENQLPYKLRDIIRRCVSDLGLNEYPEDMDQRLPAPSNGIAWSDTANAIRRAVRLAVQSNREAELLEAFLLEDGALADFAARECYSAGKIRRELEALFVRAASHLSGEGKAVGSPRLLQCRRALQDMESSRKNGIASPRRRLYFVIE